MSTVSKEIKDYLISLYGEKIQKEYEKFINENPLTYLRVNTLKTSLENIIALLKNKYGVNCQRIENLPNALKVTKGEKIVGKTLEHVTGKFYIQGLSSMLPPLVLAPKPGDKVLDLCAAPGSKTTELGELMQNKGTLVANEVQQSRVSMLVYNIDRINLTNTAVTHSRGEWLSRYFSEYFDKILVDAPCSGLGIIHKKDEINDWWSLQRAKSLGELQYKLFVSAIKLAKVGGEIVYSTCTLAPEENEIVLNNILKKYPVEIADIELPVKSNSALTKYNGEQLENSIGKAHRILPWENDSDGFFIVKLIKTDKTPSVKQASVKLRSKTLSHNSQNINKYLNNLYEDFDLEKDALDNYKFTISGNNIFFIDKNFELDNLEIFHRYGMRFGKIDNHGNTALHAQAAEILGKYCNKNIYNLKSEGELKTYIDGGTIKDYSLMGRQCIIKFENTVLGTAAITKNGLKSRFPRAKRTQNIII